jgi:hypothetical protein
MKRLLTMGLLLLGALLLTTPSFADGDDRGGYSMGPGMMGQGGGYGMGPGMMGQGGGYGMGPGMMGHGGGFGMGPFQMHPELAQLPPEKQEQLRKLHLGMMQAMIPKRADLQVKSLLLAETMHTFPLDQKTARDQRAAIDQARKEMFELRLSMMAQVQQIVGQELWERMHSGAPYGMGSSGGGPGAVPAPGRMSPGMMAPQQPR